MKEALRIELEARDSSPGATQQKASEPQVSAWVKASAGTGKTTVLTNRVMRLLLEGTSPSRILCLTYTRAAAAEMALRVMESLGAWATCDDNRLGESIGKLQGSVATQKQLEDARRLFAEVLACPGGMRIRTIHAFCQEILRRFPIEAGLPPHFAVIEESDARALQEEAQRDVLRAADAQPESDAGRALKELAGDLGEHGFAGAMDAVLDDRARLEAAAKQAGGFKKLVARMRSELSLAPEDTAEAITRAAIAALPEADIRKAGKCLAEASKRYAPRGEGILSWLALSPEERLLKFEDYCGCFFTAAGEPYAEIANKEILGKYQDLEAIVRKECARLESALERLEAAEIAETTEALFTLGMETARHYARRKAAQAALDYDDLIIKADELLRRPGIAPWVLYKLDGGLDHILVDEAQDTSRAQWNIVAALAEEFFAGSGSKPDIEPTLFVVGDEKQSIFSFQRADPEAFEEYRNFFAQKIADADKVMRPVSMQVSFRSAPAILEAVDAVFARDSAKSGVSHDAVKHEARWKEMRGRVELWPLIPAPPKEKAESGEWAPPPDYEEEHDREAELANQIADRIELALRKGEPLPGEEKPLHAGDIMVLLRRRGRFADLMVRALKKRKVPVTGVDRMCLVKQLPVMDLLALVQFALLPEDDLTLATALKGPLIGLNDDDLMKLAIGRKGTLWASLGDKVALDVRLAAAHGYLSRWLNAADFLTPFDMLAQILNEDCPASRISGLHAIWSRLGHDSIDPVNELLNAAQGFSQRHTPSLQSFLQWLVATEAEIKRELDRGDKKGGGQVRIMTVHAAKGLEAPVVFLPDAASLPRAVDVPNILWLGDVPFYIARKPRAGLARRLWDAAREKQMEEYRRLLYVALTRPANQLYVAGWEPARNEGGGESWYRLVQEGLKDRHQPAAVHENVSPVPDIVVADEDIRKKTPKAAVKLKSVEKIALPSWIRTDPPEEERKSRMATPSQFVAQPASATPDEVFSRGRIIHRLLQSLPDIVDEKREAVAARFLANPQHRLTKNQQAEIAHEVLRLLRDPAYAPLFAPGSRAEVPLAGQVAGHGIAGQVDRLCVKDGEVWIVDYKTNRPPPESAASIPEAYLLQMAAYRAILRDIYPDKKTRCFLLWTYRPLLMEVPENKG